MNSSMSSQTFGFFIFDFDYASQLQAARDLLTHNVQADVALADDIRDAEGWVSQSSGDENDFAVDHTVELIFRSIYQRVAHSMAAVGVITPFIEAVFKDAIQRAGEELPRGDFARNLQKIINRVGMDSYLPDKLAITTNALFRYRNELFHWGFEWPPHVRRNFEEAMNSWSSDWFEVANLNVQFPVFIMSPMFIEHCLQMAHDVTAGLQEFLIDRAR